MKRHTESSSPRISILITLVLFLAGIPAAALAAPPVLTVPGAQTVTENDLLTFTVSAADPEGQTCDLLAANLPSGATFVDNQNNTGASRGVRARRRTGPSLFRSSPTTRSAGRTTKRSRSRF
jgi:hypothetical protein